MTSIKQKDKNTWIVYADEIQLNKKGKAIQNKPYSRKDISLKTTDKRHVFHDYQEACKKFYLAELFRIQHETTKVKETHKPLPIKKIIQFYLGHQGYRVKYDLKQRTLETYIKDAERIPKEILETTIDKIRYEISEWWAREHRTAFNVMNAAFNVAVKNQYCEINPIKWINEELKNHRKAFGKRVKIKIRESKKAIPFYHKMDDLFEFLKKRRKRKRVNYYKINGFIRHQFT